jgi:predicted acylesterase/phospholipase RssA
MNYHSPRKQRHQAHKTEKSQQNAIVAESTSRTALVLGGGAPNSALMAGALAAFAERGVTFDVVSTSGAGGLIGLLWQAPKNGDPVQALKNWVNSYVDDHIYNKFPVDYKVFFKPGLMADAYRQWLSMLPGYQKAVDEQNANPVFRLWSDMLQLFTATLSPSGLNMQDVGLCARVPWAPDLVDFDKIKDINPYFYLNAYNITKQIMEDFSKDQITLDHFKAAFAFPFIYGPYHMNGCDYYEGASRDCLNFKDLVEKHTGLETIVVFDVLGADNLIRVPRDLYDSWVLSMIIPLVSVAEDDLKLFALQYNHGWKRSEGAKTDLLVMPFDIPEQHLDTVLDWSYSNGQRLFDIGYKSAVAFLAEHGDALTKNNSSQ